jgi:hypothetical protein
LQAVDVAVFCGDGDGDEEKKEKERRRDTDPREKPYLPLAASELLKMRFPFSPSFTSPSAMQGYLISSHLSAWLTITHQIIAPRLVLLPEAAASLLLPLLERMVKEAP